MIKRTVEYIRSRWDVLTFLMLLLLSIVCISSCKHTEYIEVEKVKKEYVNNYLKDSVYVKDSVFLYVNGDTIYKEKTKLVYRDKLIKDTVCLVDSVPYKVFVDRIETKHPKYEIYLWFYVILSVGCVLVYFKRKW